VHLTVVDPRFATVEGVRACCDELRRSGYERVVTNAIAPGDARPLVDAGFVVTEELTLLSRALDALPAPGARTRRARRLRPLAALDHRAFGDASFDVSALQDARRATPVSRVRVTGRAGAPTGYAVTGVAGTCGYVQRLAIDPDAQRRGLGRALLLDGLWWARRNGAGRAMVNTHRANLAAQSLYETAGFVALPDGLCVLERAL
jgi:GNAT superfamily N-acetyltransferase